jgi:sigma-E factor negative regulatory protein RseB
MNLRFLCFAGALLAAGTAFATPVPDGISLLNRISGAARKLNYTGTFVYQSGPHSETSRISHLIDGNSELERLEVLDGSPREVVRNNDEVKCYLPDSHLLIVEQFSQQKRFPALLPAGLAELTDYYVVRKGNSGRVAGLDSQSVMLVPRDQYRYGHLFWVHNDSGLLLKASMLNERGEVLESFAFTQLQVGGLIERSSLTSRFEGAAHPGSEWRIDYIKPQDSRVEESSWQFRNSVPGFRRIAGMKRPARPGAAESVHVVFSDGLAAVSVFIEPLAGRREVPDIAALTMGSINVYKRVVDDHLLVVMGEVPLVSLKLLGDGLEARK